MDRVSDIKYKEMFKGNKGITDMEQLTKDKAVLQQKIELYADMLYKLAFSQMKNQQDAEDVVQEVLYQYIKSHKTFESEEHEKAWLIRVALNACRKIWRSAWYKHTVPFSLPQEAAGKEAMDEELIFKEDEAALLKAVMDLPRKYREVIHLFYFENMSIKAICEVTGRKTNTITSQLTRGRELLQKTLKESYQYE